MAAFAIPDRVNTLTKRQLLDQAVKATQEAAKDGVGWQDKAALWVFAQLCLSERSGRTILCYTQVITVLTLVVTAATLYQAFWN